MRRRLDLAGALVAEPKVLFLDEPTTGLDPRSRIDLWGVIHELVANGTTLLLTTQYLEEADRLADQIMVIDHGRSIAYGNSDELKAMVGGERIEVTLPSVDDIPAARDVLAGFAVGEIHSHERTVVAPITGGAPMLTANTPDEPRRVGSADPSGALDDHADGVPGIVRSGPPR